MRKTISIISATLVLSSGIATADDLTMMIEQDLARLGYETGPVDGEETMETAIAISQFQAESGLDVDGEVTQQLARKLMAATPGSDGQSMPATATTAAPAAAAPPQQAQVSVDLRAAQQACLQKKMEKAQKKQKKKRGLSRLMSAVTRTASREGNYEVARTADDIYYAGATADDLSAAAKDLGLTDDDVAACQNPM
jgi:peptidoglycan hydrolase-like protein with peptidoglycan-binding domain